LLCRLVFRRDLSWGLCFSIYSLMTCAMPLTTPGIFFLLTTSKYSVLLDLHMTVVYFSLTSIPYKVGALLTL
jgi:hypothetical protein